MNGQGFTAGPLDPRGFPMELRVAPDLAQFRGARLREPILLLEPEPVKCPGRTCKSPKNSLVRTTVDSCRHHYCKSCGYSAIWKTTTSSPTLTHPFAAATHFPPVTWDEDICDLDALAEFDFNTTFNDESYGWLRAMTWNKHRRYTLSKVKKAREPWSPEATKPLADMKYKGEGFVFAGENIADQHGLTKWIDRQTKTGEEAFHEEENDEKRFARSGLGGKVNTGAGPTLASHLRSLVPVRSTTPYTISPAQTDEGFFVSKDRGAFCRRTVAIAKGFSNRKFSGEECGLTDEELQEKLEVTNRPDNLDSPTPAYFGEQNDDPADTAQGEQPGFIEGNNSVDQRVKVKSPEQLAQEAEEWAQIRANYDKLLHDGVAWSLADDRDQDVVVNGIRMNRDNETFRLVLFDIDLHEGHYESDSPMKELAERYGFQQFDALRNQIGGIDEKTLRTKLKKTRNYGMNKELPTTKFTAEQVADIEVHDGQVVYAHLTVGKARWYKLDLDTFDTYEDALADLRTKIVEEAWRKEYPHRRIDTATKAHLLEARKEIVSRIHPAFRKANVYIADWRRRPMTVAIAEESWGKAAF